jgi:4-hydroxybenzoate polyprenyltransferase
MYLNDAFDAEFDRQHRRERPIPSGAVSLGAVWNWSFIWMALGIGSLALLGVSAFFLAMLLAGAILLYDFIHKKTLLSPVLMALCRFLLFLLAGASAYFALGKRTPGQFARECR